MQRKKNYFIQIFGIGILSLFLLGCSEESFFVSQEKEDIRQEAIRLEEDTVEKKEVSTTENIDAEKAESAGHEIKENFEMAVHICGAVNQPGVYIFQQKARVYEGIQKAGGFREDAAMDYLNLALDLEDGMKIEVPTIEMIEKQKEEGMEEISGISYGNKDETEQTKGKIDLNTADEAMLCTLPGIGESKAKSIIAYRQEHGRFEKTEDIMMISGIKEAAYEKIKEYVTVTGK